MGKYALKNHIIILTCPLLLLSSLVNANPSITINHYQDNPRYSFGLSVLELVLQKSNIQYQLKVPQSGLNEGIGEKLVIRGELDLEFMSTTPEREKAMIAVKHPIYRGLLGARLLLVKKSNKSTFRHLFNSQGLQHFTAGHGAHWGDLPVYDANNLPVKTSAIYEALFRMLKRNRFDYFHRGIGEIWEELEQYKTDLTIADGLFLFYPHPVYFFVTKQKPELAAIIEKGFNKAVADGSYERLFKARYIAQIQKANLSSRNMIILKNPVTPDCTPLIDTSWWLPNKYQARQNQSHDNQPCKQTEE